MSGQGLSQQEWFQVLQHAQKSEKNANIDIAQVGVDIAKERTQFFEKLAIGAGATVAAIVSFLGAHAGQLRPHWILRTALISLAIALIAALLRNLLYPHYVMEARHKIWMQRQRYRLNIEKQGLQAGFTVFDADTGDLIEPVAAIADYAQNDASLGKAITSKEKREERFVLAWRTSETVCLVSISVAMIALVWLALCNF